MRKPLLCLAFAGVLAACSDAGSVDPDAIPGPELIAVRMALDSAFLHDTALDPAFTGDSGLYALMSALVFPFMDRATRIPAGSDTTPVVGIEFAINATQGGSHGTSTPTPIPACKRYRAPPNTM